MLSQHTPRRLAIVTGASRRRGLGAAVCRALAQAGSDIFFTHWSPYDRRMPWGMVEEEPAHLQRHVQASGVRCEHLMIVRRTAEALLRIMEVVEAQWRPALILVI